ncbi:MAG: hypothetical protein A2Y14_01490 [Verrucomicrobia bacterium GWF2_51_19]|nr:MAG: hypothetical protein A2Y14_01490 [Verrucomicrobia bacterium GWF2_51_19]HCJ12551.1 RNA polymerase subunit sigma [Opitutae bacterium]
MSKTAFAIDYFPDRASIDIYMDEVARYPLLSAEEEQGLVDAMQRGSESARTRLIQSNLRLVVKMAHQYKSYGLPLLDLIGEGNIGLMRAIDGFKVDKGTRVSTYATWWIKQAMRKAIIKQGKTIRIPTHIFEKIALIQKAKTAFFEQHKHVPSVAELAKWTGLPDRKVALIEEVMQKTESVDAPIIEDDEQAETFAAIIVDSQMADPQQNLDEQTLMLDVKGILSLLDPKELKVMRLRFGLSGDEGKTLEAVGKIMGLTRERVRQIERLALAKIKRILQEKDKEGPGSMADIQSRMQAFERLLKAKDIRDV